MQGATEILSQDILGDDGVTKVKGQDALSEDLFEDESVTKVTGRELGFSEVMYNFLLSRTGWGIYYHVGVFESTTAVTEQQFAEAFRILVNFQSFLRMKIQSQPDSENNPRQYFEPIPVEEAINIEWVDLVNTEDWTQLLERESSANLQPETGPLWRTIIGKVVETQKETISQCPSEINGLQYQAGEVQSNVQQKNEYVILFYMHHAIVDGVSCFDLIHNQFLPILNAIINSKPPDDNFMKPLPLPLTVENVLLGQKGPTQFNPPWYVRATLNILRWKNRTFNGAGASEKPPVFSKEIPNDNPNTCFAKLLIPAHTTSKVIKECRNHGVSVHSALLAAFSYATAQTMKEFGRNPDRLIKPNWPVDLRKYIPELTTPHTLGYFACGESSEIKLPENLELDGDHAWSLVETLNKSIIAKLNKPPLSSFGVKFLLGIVDQMINSEVNAVKVMQEAGLRIHFTFSNLGNCDAASKADAHAYPHFVDLKENYFGHSMNDVTYLLKDNVNGAFMGPFIGIVTFKGCMNIAVCFSDRWISREFVEKFLANAEDNLNQMCK